MEQRTKEQERMLLAAMLAAAGLYWRVYDNVNGHKLYTQPDDWETDGTADLILSPTRACIEGGWALGPIVVEAAGADAPLLSAVLAARMKRDVYVWHMPGGFDLRARCAFVWPLPADAEPAIEVAQHEGIGRMDYDKHRQLRFMHDGKLAWGYDDEGSVVVARSKR